MVPTHRTGPFKQQNKKHKSEKKRTGPTGVTKVRSSSKLKSQSKRERRLAAKQRRMHKVTELKKYVDQRGSQSNPIMCVITPLTEGVPAHLAQLLLRNCDPDAVDVHNSGASLQGAVYYRSPLLKKYISLVTIRANDLFGCLDLIQLADWLILVVPSDCNNLDESAERFLSALYAQGLVNTSFAVMSSTCDLKEIRDIIQARFTIPEGVLYPLNNSSQALTLLRHICSSRVLGSRGKLAKTPESMATLSAHSSARFRAGILADMIRLKNYFRNVDPQSSYLHISGQLKGAPLFLFEPLEQTVSGQPTCPVMYLPGWGDFPLFEALWSNWTGEVQHWSFNQGKSMDRQTRPLPMLNTIGDIDSDSDYSDRSGSSIEMAGSEDDSHSGGDDAMPGVHQEVPMDTVEDEAVDGSEDDWDLDDALTNYAARTINSSRGSVFSTAQLAKFRAARMEELFPDEVETPPNIPARERFKKYRCLPRFKGSVWPGENDQFPDHYDNIACFKNYTRNRRSIMHYVRKRILTSLKDQAASEQMRSRTLKYIPTGVRVELVLGPMSPETASAIITHHTVIPTGIHCPQLPPLVVWSLLPHESRISVCHLAVRRVASALHATTDLAVVTAAANKIAEKSELAAQSFESVPLSLGEEASSMLEQGDEEIRQALLEHQSRTASVRKTKLDPTNPVLSPEVEPIKSKELMLFQVGIRRFICAPIYSTFTTAPNEKAKFEKFFSHTQNDVVASVYAPVMYSPANVLQFRIRVDENEHGELSAPYVGELVATGSLHSVDPSRLIIKRIFLSGHPYKIRQRQAVVRFMFFNPTDVNFFKAVPLQTKNKASGHIKEPVGTHGLMKCVFDRPLNPADVVLMPLYKRVFPKYVYRPQIVNLCRAVPTQIYRCDISEDTIQLRRKVTSHSTTAERPCTDSTTVSGDR